MATIAFPVSPAVNDVYTFAGLTWQCVGLSPTRWARSGRGSTDHSEVQYVCGVVPVLVPMTPYIATVGIITVLPIDVPVSFTHS